MLGIRTISILKVDKINIMIILFLKQLSFVDTLM
jgi:hypothetical protein